MKILFIGHDAFRAGATILLLNFLRWLKHNHPDINFEILINQRVGDLYEEFSSIASTYWWIPKYRSRNPFRKNMHREQLKFLATRKYDLIYSNTIINGAILEDLSFLQIPVITHVHEMEYWINKSGKDNLEITKRVTKKYITASDAVKKCLVEKFDIELQKTVTIYEHVDFCKITKNQYKGKLREKLKLSNDTILIGACGAEDWRKGKDLYIQIAIDVLNRKIDKDIHFVWIGGHLNEEINYDLDHSSMTDRVHFVSHLPDANLYFKDFDIFAMLSRNDPFPVVNLEVATLGVPIVCFDNAGGTPELLADGGGFVVSYLNLHDFANKIVYLINNSDYREKQGLIIKENVKSKLDIKIIGQKLVIEMRKMLYE